MYAAPVVISDAQTIFLFEENISLLKEDGTLSFDEVKNRIFQDHKVWKNKLETDQVYWGKFEIENQTSATARHKEWVLNFHLILTDLEVFVENANGEIVKSRTGFTTPIQERTFSPIVKGNFIKIDLPVGEKATVFFRAKCERYGATPMFEVKISSAELFFKNLNADKLTRGLFMGFLMMMLIYNLFLYFYGDKDKAYIFYSIYLFAIVFFSAYNTGDVAEIVVPRFFFDSPQQITFAKTIVYFALISYLTFLRSFLDLSKLLPTWDIILKFFSILVIPMFFLDLFLIYSSNYNYDVSDVVTIGTTTFFLAVVFTFSWFLYQAKDKKGYFIVLGTIFMGLGTLLTIFSRYQTVDFTTFYFRIGIILEVIIFSLGLAYRQRSIERENQEAFFELEKSKLVQEQEHKEAERLKELDNLKNKLYTNITHEFRTPLTVIMGIADNIEGHQRQRNIINRNSSQLLRLINQMLDLSKIESNLMQLKWVQSDIVAYLQYITESFHSMARDKDVRLTFYSEEENIWMDIDESKIEHLIYNLISNAIKFTPSGGKVIVHVKKMIKDQFPFLQIKIEDSGIGIREEVLPNIFDRFYQNKNSTTGTGIGLALVKELVELLEGTIEVKSKVGSGSEFFITLPITQNAERVPSFALPANEAFQESFEPVEVEPSELEFVKDEPIPTQNIIGTEPVPDSDQPILLLIEDNKDVANYIEEFLEKRYNIQVVHDGQQGIEKAFELIPDIIISDVMMPKKDGYEVTRILKHDERTSHIPIILLTAKATQEDKINGLESGADAFLKKPFHKKELLVRLEKLQELRKQLIEKFRSDDNSIGKIHREDALNEMEATTPKPVSLDEIFLQKIKKTIFEKIADHDLAVVHLCQATGLGHTQVYRKLKALTGQTPKVYIRSIRLQQAKHLLKTTTHNVSEVAYQVGFKDPNYFSRVFFQEFDKNPSEFIVD